MISPPNISSESLTSVGSAATSQKCSGGSGPDTTIIPNSTQVVGLADTDIMFIPGMNKITLTNQHPLLHAVIQEAFEHLRASLLFNHGFPNANVTLSLIRVSLIAAAESHSPKALQIHLQLLNDREYMEKMIQLVSSITLR